MKILVVCDVLGEENNGTTMAAMNLIRSLQQKKHEVRVICPDEDKRGWKNYFIVPKLNLGYFLNKYIANVGVSLSKADKNIIEKAMDGVDHVHIMLPFSVGAKAAKIAKKKGISMTAGFHMQAENFSCYVKLNRLKLFNHLIYKFIWRKLYRYVDGIHYPSQFICDTFEHHIRRKTPSYVISNGVANDMKTQKVEKKLEFQDKILIMSMGRYAREKSQDTLLKAIPFSKYKDKIQLVLTGRGSKEKYYKKLGEKLVNKPIFGLVKREELISLLNSADLYVHPAEIELEGIACLEAISLGKLVIVSDSKLSATKYFAANKNCIFKSRNPKDLARTIDYWIEHEDEKKECEKKYLEQSKNLTFDHCMDMMEQMIFEVHNEKREKDSLL